MCNGMCIDGAVSLSMGAVGANDSGSEDGKDSSFGRLLSICCCGDAIIPELMAGTGGTGVSDEDVDREEL